MEEMRSLPPRTIVPVTLPRTLSHRSGSIMIAGPFLGTLPPGQISPTVLDRAGGRSLCRIRRQTVAVYRTRGQCATTTAARATREKPDGGTGIEVSEMSPLIARASRNLLAARVHSIAA